MTFIKILSLGDKNVRDYAEGNVQRFEQILFSFGRTFQRSDSADESFWGVHQLQTMALMSSMVSHIKTNATLMLMTMTMIMFLTMSHCWEECYSGLQWVELFSIYCCTDLTDVENIPNKRIYSEKEIILVGLAWIKPPPLKKKTEIFGGDEQKECYHRWR